MKTLSLCAVILFSIFSTNTSVAQTLKKETIKVWGNCGMCKTKIEKAAKSAGASTASWNENSKVLKVSYAVSKTSGTKIQEAIAKTGYDTQDFTADNSAYEKLPGCCQYERKDAAVSSDTKKCCSNEASCKHDGKADASKGMSCCSEKACADKTACKHDGKNHDCKDMACCKDKSCCKKEAIVD